MAAADQAVARLLADRTAAGHPPTPSPDVLRQIGSIIASAGQRLEQTGKATDGRPAGRPAQRDAA